MAKTTDPTVANTIHQQIVHADFWALPSCGAQAHTYNAKSMTYKVGGGPMRFITITLNPRDLYDVELFRIKRGSYDRVTMAEMEDIYADKLASVVRDLCAGKRTTAGFHSQIPTFQTSDGYTLYYLNDMWVDSLDPKTIDMTFQADENGYPIDMNGERLDGQYTDPSSLEVSGTKRLPKLRDSIGTFGNIKTVKHLREALLSASQRLRELGHSNVAADWEERVRKMPSRMGKEAINYVLLSACREVDKLKLPPGEMTVSGGKRPPKHETEPIVPVIFRKWKQSPHTVIALFPTEPATRRRGEVLSYEHIGQHGAADYSGVISLTKPAKPSEYRALKKELEGIGYRLKVVQRQTPALRKEYEANFR